VTGVDQVVGVGEKRTRWSVRSRPHGGPILRPGDVVAFGPKKQRRMSTPRAAKRLEQKVRSKKGMDLAGFSIALKQMQSMGR